MVGNIFYPKSPLHDGAVIIKEGRVVSAGCILPLTGHNNLSSELGTRHRAAIGMSETSDAVVVVVSEETGKISLALNEYLETRQSDKEKIDDEPFVQQMKQAEAAYFAAENTFKRIANLYKSGSTTQQNYDSADTWFLPNPVPQNACSIRWQHLHR